MEDRSPRFRIGQLAERTGVDRERLRKWETRYALLEPERTRGGFRLYSSEDERRVRLMQRHLGGGYAAAEAAELAREGVVSPAPARLTDALPAAVVRRSHRLLERALRDYDEAAAQRALDDLLKAFKLEAVLRDAVLPFLRRTGDAWVGGAVTPGQEHFASTIIESRLMGLTPGWGSGGGPRALLACPSGERHTLGLLSFGIVLSRRGWRITYLGADTPTDSIAHAASTMRPTTIVLAAARRHAFTRRADELARLARAHRMMIAGAGATARTAETLRAGLIAADPVSAAIALSSHLRPEA
jgi:DNA-binding transcriptional MerR regulator